MTEEKKNQGRKNRVSGAKFELKVRDFMVDEGWFVSKSEINVDLEKGKIVPAKGGRFRIKSTGFPDFICWKQVDGLYAVIGVECKGGNKSNKYLDKEEKEKCKFMLDEELFDKIYLATKKKVGRRVDVELKEV